MKKQSMEKEDPKNTANNLDGMKIIKPEEDIKHFPIDQSEVFGPKAGIPKSTSYTESDKANY